MPLVTEVIRDGEPVKYNWDQNTLNAFLTTALKESDPETISYLLNGKELKPGHVIDFSWYPVYYIETRCPLWKTGKLVIANRYAYIATSQDGDFVSTIVFEPGDTFKMWREH
jgi:hypothetical protein